MLVSFNNLSINLIAEEAKKNDGKDFSFEAGIALVEKIASCVDSTLPNIRHVQKGDTLGTIFFALKLEPYNDERMQEISVKYLGSDNRILTQKERNPELKLAQAHLVYPDQYVAIKEDEMIVADTDSLNLLVETLKS